jgi:hypothetical protein
MIKYKHPDIDIDDYYPIKTTGNRYTKDPHRHDEGQINSDLKEFVSDTETTKENKITEYKHPDSGIVFEVGQVWKNDDGGKFEIVEINKGITYPIKARKISQDGVSFPDRPWFIFTKNGAFIDDYKKKNCIDLKRLVINIGETVKNNEVKP